MCMCVGAGPAWPSAAAAAEQLRCSLLWLGGAAYVEKDAFAQQVCRVLSSQLCLARMLWSQLWALSCTSCSLCRLRLEFACLAGCVRAAAGGCQAPFAALLAAACLQVRLACTYAQGVHCIPACSQLGCRCTSKRPRWPLSG